MTSNQEPQVVRNVDDLHPGDIVELWGKRWRVSHRHLNRPMLWAEKVDLGSLDYVHTRLAVEAGTVTRPAAVEDDTAQVERLFDLLGRCVENNVSILEARALHRAGVRVPEQQP